MNRIFKAVRPPTHPDSGFVNPFIRYEVLPNGDYYLLYFINGRWNRISIRMTNFPFAGMVNWIFVEDNKETTAYEDIII